MKEQMIATTYGNICVYIQGSGPKKIVLLHGGGCDSAMLSWREVMNTFSEDYTVYAMDFLGYGKSDSYAKICGKKFYRIHADCISQVVETLKIDRFALAGLSMGGAIAIGFALKYPEKVTTLFPVDSWGLAEKIPFHGFCNWYIHKTNMTVWQYSLLARSRFLAKWAIAYSLIGNKKIITHALVSEVIEACKGDNAGKSMQDFQRSSIVKEGTVPFYGEKLKELTIPVMFLNGEKDPLVSVKASEQAAETVPDGKCYVLKGCKHWSVKEQPEQFVEIVEKHCK